MRHVGILLLFAAWLGFLTTPCPAQNKFPNKDTATNRHDYNWGTVKDDDTATATFGRDNATGDSVTHVKPAPGKEEVDWYDKVIITVNPHVKWGDSTTTTSTYDNATDTGTTTTTTTTQE